MVGIRLARLEIQALSGSGHEPMVSGRVLVIGQERSDLPETIGRFGDILLWGDRIVEIGSRLIFANLVVGGRQEPAGNGLRTTSTRWPRHGARGVKREARG